MTEERNPLPRWGYGALLVSHSVPCRGGDATMFSALCAQWLRDHATDSRQFAGDDQQAPRWLRYVENANLSKLY